MATLARRAFVRKRTEDSRTGEPRGNGILDRSWLLWVVVLAFVAVAAFVAIGLGGGAAERNAIHAMPDPQRRELYEDTRRTSEALCAQAQATMSLEDRCIDLAEFLLSFPECDDACRAFAAAHRHRPSR
jgi:hypothetical protein